MYGEVMFKYVSGKRDEESMLGLDHDGPGDSRRTETQPIEILKRVMKAAEDCFGTPPE